MEKLKLYIETSLFGFYFDAHLRNKTKRESVRILFGQVKLGLMDGYVSDITYGEIAKSDEPFRSRDIELINQVGFQRLVVDETELAALYEAYTRDNVLPEKFHADLLHVAAATVAPIDVLVTLNCEHIANETIIRRIRSVNMREGFRTDLSIRTPEEVIVYEVEE